MSTQSGGSEQQFTNRNIFAMHY